MNNLGVDPEFFIRNKKNGKALSAHRLLGDNTIKNGKYNLAPRAHSGKDTAEVDRDGAALEVRNTLVTPCRDYLVPYVGQAIQLTYHELIKKYGENKYEFSTAPVFELGDLRGPPDIREFGCNPDFNAYTMQEQNPTLPKGERRRFTGGHIHFSGPFNKGSSIQEQAAAAVLMDALIGLPLVAILGEPFANGEAERREFYGKAGSFRYDARKGKLEYRTLSGRLLLHPVIMTWALGIAKQMVPYYFHNNKIPGATFLGGVKSLSSVIDVEEIARVINEHDVPAAEALYGPIFNHFNAAMLNRKDAYITKDAMRKSQGGYAFIPFEVVVDLMVEANHNGVHFKDDMLFNWQLYKDNPIRDHGYVGVHNAMNGYYDELIFPQRPFLKNHIKGGYDAPMQAHYLGDSEQVKAALKKERGW